MAWNWRDPRHRIEVEADLRYAAARTERVLGVSRKLDAVLAAGIEEGKRVSEERGVSVSNGMAAAVRSPAVQVLPPIQIRGLAADVMTVKRGFAEIREVVQDVNQVAAALKQDLHDVKAQLHQHREDIRFEAETLGNG